MCSHNLFMKNPCKAQGYCFYSPFRGRYCFLTVSSIWWALLRPNITIALLSSTNWVMCLPCPTRLWHQVVFHAKLAPSTHDPQTILTSAFRAFWLPVLPQFFEVLLGVLPVEYNLARSILAIHFRPTWWHCYPQQSCANVCCSTTESYLRPAGAASACIIQK